MQESMTVIVAMPPWASQRFSLDFRRSDVPLCSWDVPSLDADTVAFSTHTELAKCAAQHLLPCDL